MIQGIEQPAIIQIDNALRLRKYDGVHDFALEWYLDEETVYLVDGKRDPYTIERLGGMYRYLNNAGELYFIEVLENRTYKPIFSDGCKANTVIHYHALLSKAFKTAMKKKILRENPIEEVDHPKKNVYHATFYTVDEMLTLMEAFCEDPLDLPVQIAAYYGLRRSEVLGLKWDAIDFTRKTISIRHKVIEAEINGKFVPVGEDVLKTKSSFRTLPLIPEIEVLLLKEKEKQEMYRRLFKKSYCRDYLDYICVDQTGKLLQPNYVTEHFAWVIEKYDLKKIRFHDLRHTCASLLLSKGISMKQIQIWLGHSTFSTTADIYAHLDYSAQEESASAMTGMFARSDAAEASA